MKVKYYVYCTNNTWNLKALGQLVLALFTLPNTVIQPLLRYKMEGED